MATQNRTYRNTKSQTASRRRLMKRRGARQGAVSVAMLNSFTWLAAWTALTFVGSSIVGNMALEKARCDRIANTERAKVAASEISRLRKQLDDVTGLDSIDRWATSQGMELSGVPKLNPAPEPAISTQPLVVQGNSKTTYVASNQ